MSYGRNPYYIYSNGETMHFGLGQGKHVQVPEDALDALLYKIALRGELGKRLQNGKKIWLDAQPNLEESFSERENEIIKQLMHGGRE